MKTLIIYLIGISLWFQSCYTYGAIDLNNSSLVVVKNYKIRQDPKFVKFKLETISESTITLLEGYTQINIQISKIKEIEESRFSTLKTMGIGIGNMFSCSGCNWSCISEQYVL